jgi:hypothetical protein
MNAFDNTARVYYIFIWKKFIPSKQDCKRKPNWNERNIVQFTQRKTKNTRGSNRISKKAIFLVAVGSTGIGMVYIS